VAACVVPVPPQPDRGSSRRWTSWSPHAGIVVVIPCLPAARARPVAALPSATAMRWPPPLCADPPGPSGRFACGNKGPIVAYAPSEITSHGTKPRLAHQPAEPSATRQGPRAAYRLVRAPRTVPPAPLPALLGPVSAVVQPPFRKGS